MIYQKYYYSVVRIFFCIMHLFFMVTYAYNDSFNTLSSLVTYAQQHTENPSIDNNSWVEPDFGSFYKLLVPSYRTRLKEFFGFNTSYLSVELFKKKIVDVLDQREIKGYVGNFIQKITPKTDDAFIVWGDLYGAFHSLVRDLQFLHDRGIINESLKIIDPHYYFVFNGNVIGRTPYNLEILMVILHLMLVNNDQVIYLKGKREDKQAWLYTNFANELKIRARGFSGGDVPLSSILTRFFNTLPLTLFLRGSSGTTDQSVVRIDAYNLDKNGFKSSIYESFLSELGSGSLETLKLNTELVGGVKKPFKVECSIESEDRMTRYKKTDGLVLLDSEKGLTTWSIFSSGTIASRKLYNFFYDAFAQINVVNHEINSWTISLINRDVRNDRLDFQTAATYQLISGLQIDKNQLLKKNKQKDLESRVMVLEDAFQNLQVKSAEVKSDAPAINASAVTPAAVVVPVPKPAAISAPAINTPVEGAVQEKLLSSKKTIFGCTIDLSKGMSVQGDLFKKGLLLRFKKEEQEGGILSSIRIEDDQYNPQITRTLVEAFMKEGITLLLASSGSPTLESYLDLIQSGAVLVFFPSTGATIFRDAALKYIVHWRASYDFEGEVLMTYALDVIGAKKIVIFYQNDLFGKALLQGVDRVIAQRGITNLIKVPYDRNSSDFSTQEKTIKGYDCDAILFLSTTIAGKELIRQLSASYCARKKLLGSSEFGEDTFKVFIKEQGVNFINLNVVPNPRTSQLPIVKEFREYGTQNDVPIDPFVLEAYISADLTFEIAKKASGSLQKDALIKSFEGINDYNYKGLMLHFNPSTRELMNKVWIDTGKDEWEIFEKVFKPSDQKGSNAPVKSEAVTLAKNEPANSAVKAESRSVSFASLLDLSKGLSTQGEMIKKGLLLRFDQEKETNRLLLPTLYIRDDGYTPSKTKELAVQTLADGIDIFIDSSGSSTLAACLDLIRAKKMLALFPVTGAPLFRKEDLPYIIHWRGSYDFEGEVLIQYATNTLKAAKIALLYQNDDFGHGLLDGVKRKVGQAQAISLLELPYERNTVNFAEQIKLCKESKTDAILFLSTAPAAKEFIRGIGASNLLNIHLLGCSDCGEDSFKKFIQEQGVRFFCVNCVPNPKKSDLPIVREFRELAKKNDLPLDPLLMEAYISADLLFYFLNKINGPITKESLREAISKTHNHNHKGLLLDFNEKTNELMNQVWIDTGADEWQSVSKSMVSNGDVANKPV